MSAVPIPRRPHHIGSGTSTVHIVYHDPTPSLPTPLPLSARRVPPGCSQWWAEVSRYTHTALEEHGVRPHQSYIYVEHAINAARRALADRTIQVRMTLEGQNGSHPTRRLARALEAWSINRTESILSGRDPDLARVQTVVRELEALDEYLAS